MTASWRSNHERDAQGSDGEGTPLLCKLHLADLQGSFAGDLIVLAVKAFCTKYRVHEHSSCTVHC